MEPVEEMRIVAFAVEGDKSNWQIVMPSGAQLALQFELELDDTDAVQDFINHMEGKIRAHLTERAWTPSNDGFTPDRREDGR